VNFTEDWLGYLPTKAQIISVLPTVLLVLALVINVALAATVVVPRARNRGDLIAQLNSLEEKVKAAEERQKRLPEELAVSIEIAMTARQDAARPFFSDSEASEALNRLYQYAEASHVEITQLEGDGSTAQGKSALYDVRMFSLEAKGTFPNLLQFVSRIRETTRESFVLSNLSITSEDDFDTLTLRLTVYTSPLGGSPPSRAKSPQVAGEASPQSSPAPVAVSLDAETNGSAVQTPQSQPAAAPSPEPTGDAYLIYTVRSGDTLSSIARNYGTTVDTLMALNNLDTTVILVGQRLRVPAP